MFEIPSKLSKNIKKPAKNIKKPQNTEKMLKYRLNFLKIPQNC